MGQKFFDDVQDVCSPLSMAQMKKQLKKWVPRMMLPLLPELNSEHIFSDAKTKASGGSITYYGLPKAKALLQINI